MPSPAAPERAPRMFVTESVLGSEIFRLDAEKERRVRRELLVIIIFGVLLVNFVQGALSNLMFMILSSVSKNYHKHAITTTPR
jgi:hypothetical protein